MRRFVAVIEQPIHANRWELTRASPELSEQRPEAFLDPLVSKNANNILCSIHDFYRTRMLDGEPRIGLAGIFRHLIATKFLILKNSQNFG